MTKENLEQLLVDYGVSFTSALADRLLQEFNPGICDDAISRQEAVYVASGFCHPSNIVDELAKLPPVNPQPKTGHWIDHQEGRWIYAKCSECGTVHDTQTNYCPNCGAHMVESEEQA